MRVTYNDSVSILHGSHASSDKVSDYNLAWNERITRARITVHPHYFISAIKFGSSNGSEYGTCVDNSQRRNRVVTAKNASGYLSLFRGTAKKVGGQQTLRFLKFLWAYRKTMTLCSSCGESI